MLKRLALNASVIVLAAAVIAPQMAVAQDEQDDQDDSGEVIVVTGSFIKKKNQVDLPSPLQTVGAADIDAIGAQNIADITQTLTINTGAQNNPDAFTQNATTGTSNINLRGLGVSSTLVLLNGKRQVLSGSPTDDGINFIDTSSLVPLIAVDRVEILKDGASALYGSDAVAGVVNFITRENYDGILLSGDYTTHQSRGDYNEYNIQALMGKSFDRGSIMVAASYLDRSALTTAERRLSRPQDDTSVLGNPGAFFGFPGLPAGAPLIDPGCADAGGFPTPLGPTIAPGLTIGLCGFDFGDFFNLVPEEERFVGLARGEIDLTDAIYWNAEFTYADNEAVRGNSPTFPFLQLGSAVVPGGAFGPNANPFNLFPGDPTLVFFGRASGNGGTVSPNVTTSETWRASTSLGGNIGTGSWEISFTRANNNFVVATEDTVTDRFQCALAGFNSVPAIPGITGGTDCSNANPDLTTGGISIPSVGTFFNPFSTAITAGVGNNEVLLDYVIGTQIRDYESDLSVVEGFISQDLFELSGGPAAIAVGAQYRDNDLSQSVDSLSLNDGFAFLIGGRPFNGSQDVFGFFTELSIPLASWIDVQAAVRHERYGDDEGGSTTDPKIAVLLRPTDSISLRGSFSTSFRAPSVFQQFGESTTLQQVSDPLAGGGNAFVAVRTLAPGGGTSARPLLPEESEAFNLGASWAPFGGLQFDVDYFNFDFTNVIIATSPQAIINADPTGPDVIRAPSGTIVQVNNDFVNASSVETAGIDFSARWAIDTSAGTFTPSFIGTYITNYDIVDPQAGAVSGEGVRNFNNFGSPTPQLRFNAGLDWSIGPHTANVFVRHIDSYSDDQNGGITIDSDTRVDIQYSLAINEYLDRDKLAAITIGGRNIFGEEPPQVFTNGGFDSRVHDPRGALLYLGLDLEL
ncbi:MAG: TonB-dependent receptor [Wenzhouxiangellaceae bacterium]